MGKSRPTSDKDVKKSTREDQLLIIIDEWLTLTAVYFTIRGCGLVESLCDSPRGLAGGGGGT